MKKPVPISLAFLLCAACTTGLAERPRQTIEAPAAAQFDPAALDRLRADIGAGQFGNVHALLAAHRGAIVFEAYRPGHDHALAEDLGLVAHGPDTLHDLRSATKTVVSTLVGIAIARGEIPSVDTPVHRLLPRHAQLFTEASRAITVRHLLMMSSGLEWREFGLRWSDPANDERKLLESEEPMRFILQREMDSSPGTGWSYSAGSTHLLAAIVEAQTGKPIQRYLREHLLAPLGISRFEWRANYGDRTNMAAGLRLAARDFMKLGIMYAQGGRWRGRQIVPAGWLAEAMAAQIEMPADPARPKWVRRAAYGYQWWRFTYDSPRGTIEVPFANGNGGQRIFVVPSHDLVVVTLGGLYYEPAPMAQILFRVLEALPGEDRRD